MNGRIIALSVAGLLGAACGGSNKAATGSTTPTTTDSTEKVAKVMCKGINECKGKGACAVNACAGSNQCKGQGWLSVTEEECKTKGGEIVSAKPAPAPAADAPATPAS
jgi:hypothetical protein